MLAFWHRDASRAWHKRHIALQEARGRSRHHTAAKIYNADLLGHSDARFFCKWYSMQLDCQSYLTACILPNTHALTQHVEFTWSLLCHIFLRGKQKNCLLFKQVGHYVRRRSSSACNQQHSSTLYATTKMPLTGFIVKMSQKCRRQRTAAAWHKKMAWCSNHLLEKRNNHYERSFLKKC